ncbi:MAG: hypothetical protein FWH37_08330 [Candidatus Bathyarchaeota archaeon]|nr:hypothetical protein [Candidatus Termiticorpusculum sp.]
MNNILAYPVKLEKWRLNEFNIKSKFNICCFFSKKSLFFVSLLFISTIVLAPLISTANGWVAINIYVENENELRNALNTAPNNKIYSICIVNDIVLEKSLEIFDGKVIDLLGSINLIGANGVDTIIVKSGGTLSLYGNFVITHAGDDMGRGVHVERDGIFNLYGGIISGNRATNGGGIYNEGVFNMYWDINAQDSTILNNTATNGGGVYNAGTFTLYGGYICNNTCINSGVGGGVCNVGTFSIISGCIFNNIAIRGGGVYNTGALDGDIITVIGQNTALSGEGHDVFTEEATGGSYLLLVVIVVVVGVVASLLFYRSKKQMHPTTNNLSHSITT